jgi:hypothetical protein
LRQEGFRTAVDQQLRMQELLDRIECEPKDLKTVLCPLFATNVTQQAVFYRVFDEVFPALGAAVPAPAQVADSQALQPSALVAGAATASDKSSARLARLRWLLVVAVILGGGAMFWIANKPVVQPVPPQPVVLTPPVPLPLPTGQPAPVPIDPTRTLNLSLPPQVPTIHPEAKRIAFEWSAIFTPLLAFAAFVLYRQLRRRINADRQAKLQEPHFWPLQLEALGSRVFPTQDLRELARRMRQREDAAQFALDVPETISATIRGHGFPNFRYRPIRRPPEYIVLIERMSNADHFASINADLARILQADGVLVSRYYFEGDTRRLFTDSGEQIELDYLASRTAESRLLLFGTSGCLFHPVSGRLEPWAAPLFDHYKLKAALLADAARPKRVIRLQEIGFAVVAADSAGLRQAVDFFESGGVPAGKTFPTFRPLEGPLSEEQLESGAGGSQEPWLAACAVYPEINWNLTLRLASAIDPTLLSEASASRMARMPWLRQGEIPLHWRERLADSIPDALRLPVRQSLFALLNTQAVPKDTFAWESWQHTLRAFCAPSSSWRERLLAAVSSRGSDTLTHEAARDLICLRFLDRLPARRLVPERLRPFVFEQGISILGTRTMAWLPAAVLAVLLLAGALRPWQIHEQDIRNVEGTVVDDTGQPYANAKINNTTAGAGEFSVSLAGDVLPVTTTRPFWPQEIRMVSGGKVEVVVGKKHPQTGPVKILHVDHVRTGESVQFFVDYTGPVVAAQAVCGKVGVADSHVDPSQDLLALPPLALASSETHTCRIELTSSGKDGDYRENVTVPAESKPPGSKPSTSSTAPAGAQPEKIVVNLLAWYKLDGDGSDWTHANNFFALTNAPFERLSSGRSALYLNGIYDFGDQAKGYRAVASLPRLNYESFTVALDFNADVFNTQKSVILYGGTSYRWWGLGWDGGLLAVTLNNKSFKSTYPGAKLNPGQWHNVICSVNVADRIVRTTLDGRALADVSLPKGFNLEVKPPASDTSDKNLTFTDYSNATVFQGYAANLRVYDRALSAAGIQSLYASIASQTPSGLPSGSNTAPANIKPDILTFEVTPSRITAGEPVTLSWKVTGTNPLQLSYASVSLDPASGTGPPNQFVIRPTATTTFTLAFQDSSLSALSKSVTVTVDPPSPATPRSLPNQPNVTVTFTNDTGEPVEVFWVDLDGKEKGYGGIANGAKWTQQTSAGSIWRFRQNGQLVGEYRVPNINPAAQSKPVPPQYTIRTAAPAGTLQLGPVGGDGGTPFSFVTTSLDYIRMGVGGSIDSISFLVPMADLQKDFGSLKDAKVQTFTLDLLAGEEITGIGVSSGKLVDRIKFYTNKRESPWFGGTGGGPEQVLKIPPGGRFAGFVGRAGDSLDAIGLLYTQ